MDINPRGDSDQERILPEDSPVEVQIKEKKKKKIRKVKSNGHISQSNGHERLGNHMSSQSDTQVPLQPMGSREKLIRIHEQLTGDPSNLPEIDRDEKDIRKLALHLAVNKSREDRNTKFAHYDYVLVHKSGDNRNVHEKLRHKFENELHEQGFRIGRKYTTDKTFVILHCSFERLCEEAESVALEMPLAGYTVPETGKNEMWIPKQLMDRFRTDDEVDFVSAPFCVSKSQIYEGIENPDIFFRPALRSLLVHHILTNIDVRDKEIKLLGQNPQGLGYMLIEGAYIDAFIIHEKSECDLQFPLSGTDNADTFLHGQDISDPRKALHDTWVRQYKFQPLWKIRNYFGEKIALYFGWLGLLTSSLILPMLLGFIIFLWGLIVANRQFYEKITPHDGVKENPLSERENSTVTLQITVWAKNAFDNDATPFFALIICLWGTLFLELWKRTNARLAYQWDVDQFEEQEPNRPQYYGTVLKRDPVTGEEISVYPFIRRFCKMSGSFGIMVFMICLVLGSLVAVIIYRVIAREDFFADRGEAGLLLASVTSTFLNTCSIMIMGKVYQKLAVFLTDWENHRTQTSYDDALIIKLFGFQFVNSYTSLFYIAFFRQNTKESGVINRGAKYSDACGVNNDCMTLLSLQVAMLMVMKPLPKVFSDVIKPWLKGLWKRGCCASKNKVDKEGKTGFIVEDYLENERTKEPLGDFTLSEYNEKVLQYGYLMLFAAAFPLAPLIALLTNAIDMKVDARRLLWTNRRPVAFRAEDIGMWYTILEFLNVAGVVTNSFLVAFTSSYGRSWEGEISTTNNTELVFNSTSNATQPVVTITEHLPGPSRLWLIIGFEHIVFTVKYFIAVIIPDVPADVKMAISKEKFHVTNILSKAGMRKGPGKTLAESSASFKSRGESNTQLPEVLPTSNARRLPSSPEGQTNWDLRDREGGKLEVVVEGLPRGSALGNKPPSPRASRRLDPLPISYTSKHSN